MIIQVKVEATSGHRIQMPQYTRDGDAGMDVRAAETVTISAKKTEVIPLGFKVAVPAGFELQIRPRSGVSLNTNLRIANSPGTIDSNYRGVVGVIVENTGRKPVTIQAGDRIAQIVLNKVPEFNMQRVDKLDDTDRGENGFGSSGIK
jgi:dUTP pyrophosphatase